MREKREIREKIFDSAEDVEDENKNFAEKEKNKERKAKRNGTQLK